jgi:hypothetical protein
MTTTSGLATHMTAVLGALGDGKLTTDQIADHLTMIDRKRVSAAACRLIQRGYVEREETGVYRLTDAGRTCLASGDAIRVGRHRPLAGQRYPQRNSVRQRAWTAVRLRRRFVAGDILTLVMQPGDDERRTREHLVRWFGELERAGYLRRLPERSDDGKPTSNGEIVWLLVRDTGATAPTIKENGEVFDHNTRTLATIGGAA